MRIQNTINKIIYFKNVQLYNLKNWWADRNTAYYILNIKNVISIIFNCQHILQHFCNLTLKSIFIVPSRKLRLMYYQISEF